ncbi:MAG TPA: hypothetical protein VMF06_07470 [Candidatus Limnocylindria bacterium]|nr:hypothetical protein [Candidatus Limnocylindria bacterium]
MELKLECGCGQRYAFDVEPVDGRMPVSVDCPSCGKDSTEEANAAIAKAAPVVRVVAPSLPKMSMASHHASASEPKPAVSVPPPPVSSIPPAPSRPPGRTAPDPAERLAASGGARVGLGVLGAFLGAALGSGIVYGFTAATDFRFPLVGVATGYLTALGSRLLARGGDTTLGIVSAVFAVLSVAGTLLALDMFSLWSIISVVISASIAYRTASN